MAARSQTVTLGVFALLIAAAVAFNLSRVHFHLDATLSAEPHKQRSKVVQSLRATLKSLVSRQAKNDTAAVAARVKISLGEAMDAALTQERDAAVALIERDLKIDDIMPALPPVTEGPIPEQFQGYGKEDYDEAVERRVAELEAEMKLNPAAKHGFFIQFGVHPPPWPFNKIIDARGKDTGVVGLAAPFTTFYYNSEYEKALFWRLKANGHVMLGISSYEFFPGNATDPLTDRKPQQNPEDKETYAAMDGWLHCFQKPWEHLPPGMPRALISQSDYIDPLHVDSRPRGLPRKYLFSMSNLGGAWNDFNRNWTLAKECIKLAVQHENAPILVVGKEVDKDQTAMSDIMELVRQGRVELTKMIGHTELTNAMEQSEFFFVPNLSDASPRVAAEAMLRDVPVMMNRHIVGGWKYINEQTGVFFDGADDFLPALERLRALRAAGKLRPHAWFSEHFGPRKTSLRVQAFLELAAGRERLAYARSIARDRW